MIRRKKTKAFQHHNFLLLYPNFKTDFCVRFKKTEAYSQIQWSTIF